MRGVILGVLLILSGACGDDDAPKPETNKAVVERIEALTDCLALQAEFDTADRNGRTDYMEVADERMREVGCYEEDR